MENRLAHGQVVDLIIGPYADPPDSWLAAARSGQARTHLKAAIARREAEDAAAAGRIQVARAVAGRRRLAARPGGQRHRLQRRPPPRLPRPRRPLRGGRPRRPDPERVPGRPGPGTVGRGRPARALVTVTVRPGDGGPARASVTTLRWDALRSKSSSIARASGSTMATVMSSPAKARIASRDSRTCARSARRCRPGQDHGAAGTRRRSRAAPAVEAAACRRNSGCILGAARRGRRRPRPDGQFAHIAHARHRLPPH